MESNSEVNRWNIIIENEEEWIAELKQVGVYIDPIAIRFIVRPKVSEFGIKQLENFIQSKDIKTLKYNTFQYIVLYLIFGIQSYRLPISLFDFNVTMDSLEEKRKNKVNPIEFTKEIVSKIRTSQ